MNYKNINAMDLKKATRKTTFLRPYVSYQKLVVGFYV